VINTPSWFSLPPRQASSWLVEISKYMNREKPLDESGSESRRVWFPLVVLTAAALILAGIFAFSQRESSLPVENESAEPMPLPEFPMQRAAESAEQELLPFPAPAPPPLLQSSSVPPAPVEALPSHPEASPQIRSLVDSLLHPERFQGTPEERALQWRTQLQELVQKGADAVPGIAEFLRRNQDYDFGQSGTQELGYGSARRAMLDALHAIGGPEAIGAMNDVLRSTLHPSEIGILARQLESLAPGEYRDSILESARAALHSGREGALGRLDMAPVFEVFKTFGDAGVVGELEEAAKRWNYYAAISLAQLPDGAGVPSLIRMAGGGPDAPGSRLNALEMLAYLAGEHPEAREALLSQVRQNQIPPNHWPYLVPFLAGEEYQFRESFLNEHVVTHETDKFKSSHVRASNQNFYTLPGPGLAPGQIDQTEAFLNEMINANQHQNPAAEKALQEAQNRLATYREQLLASPPNPLVQ
jgi:hypothetical protein